MSQMELDHVLATYVVSPKTNTDLFALFAYQFFHGHGLEVNDRPIRSLLLPARRREDDLEYVVCCGS